MPTSRLSPSGPAPQRACSAATNASVAVARIGSDRAGRREGFATIPNDRTPPHRYAAPKPVSNRRLSVAVTTGKSGSPSQLPHPPNERPCQYRPLFAHAHARLREDDPEPPSRSPHQVPTPPVAEQAANLETVTENLSQIDNFKADLASGLARPAPSPPQRATKPKHTTLRARARVVDRCRPNVSPYGLTQVGLTRAPQANEYENIIDFGLG